MTLDKLIKTSYGSDDQIFANHEFDRQQALKALVMANEEGVGMEEFLQKHRDYLISKNRSSEHIERQVLRIQDINLYFRND